MSQVLYIFVTLSRRLFAFLFFVLVLLGGGLSFYFWLSEQTISKTLSHHPSVYAHSMKPHRIRFIDGGAESLQARLNLIEEATNTIDLETFIYDLDESSQLISLALIKAASRGVKVRVLIDFAAPVFQFAPRYAFYLRRFGVDVRYYNAAHPLSPIDIQHRSHRKLLIIDGSTVITGGRNIGNDYFDLSNKYGFIDSDLIVSGPIVLTVRDSFNTYWDDNLSFQPRFTSEDDNAAQAEVAEFFTRSKGSQALAQRIRNYKVPSPESDTWSECGDLVFVTDFPGIELEHRQVFKHLKEILKQASVSIDIESPYLILREEGAALLREMSERGINTTILTNGLKTTDAYYTVSATAASITALERTGVKYLLYSGSAPHEHIHLSSPTPNRWGLHAKRAVIDERHILIGTYNIDPRSANLNSELIFMCRDNPELAAKMLASMKKRREGAKLLFEEQVFALQRLIEGSSQTDILKFVLAIPFALAFDSLL